MMDISSRMRSATRMARIFEATVNFPPDNKPPDIFTHYAAFSLPVRGDTLVSSRCQALRLAAALPCSFRRLLPSSRQPSQ
jgi:hypothetical protein